MCWLEAGEALAAVARSLGITRKVLYDWRKAWWAEGAGGLSPFAWHPQWERNGAPQLNRRFFKPTGRTMTEEDWAAWTAVKAIVEAHVRAPDSTSPMAREFLNSELNLELYKGYPGSFRPWDRQLRQSILLGTTDAVITLAPVEGTLHQFNNLDTLGFEEPEFSCP